LPSFRFNKVFSVARGVKAFLTLESGITRGALPGTGPQAGGPKNLRRHIRKQKKMLKGKDQEISQLKGELRAAKEQAYSEAGVSGTELAKALQYEEQAEDLRNIRQHISTQKSRLKSKDQELFQLKNELRDVMEQLGSVQDGPPTPLSGEPEVGTLPDFVVIGAQKCGTTTLYHHLTQHPYVERAATKELHFFDNHFDKGVEWYRRCFPPPKWKDGQKTVTGEATPKYLFRPDIPEKAAEIIPQAKLIVLLRNPVDRTYSQFHHGARNGRREAMGFEEAVETFLKFAEAEKAWPSGKENDTPEREHHVQDIRSLIKRSIYVDQLQRWSRFFSDEQILVLKSEDFFKRTSENLKLVLDFLGLPAWEPETESDTSRVRNQGTYTRRMAPETRRRLEEYFEPHNQRLYDYLGVDFGW
jgi:hypothetical protein